jgi:hypothetical protein
MIDSGCLPGVSAVQPRGTWQHYQLEAAGVHGAPVPSVTGRALVPALGPID